MGTPYAPRRTGPLWIASAAGDHLLAVPSWEPSSVLRSEALAVPIWWACAASRTLITAGVFSGRTSDAAATPET